MKRLNFIGLNIILFLGLAVGYSSTPDEMLRRVDEHRLIGNNFEMTIRIEGYVNNYIKDSTVMRGYVNDGKMSQIVFLEPLKVKDRKIIIKDNEMWLIIPKVKNPIHITPSQRLVGGISYGDVAASSFADGYTVKLNGEEMIVGMSPDGTKTEASKCYLLELTAKGKNPNYNKVILWIERQNYLPVKADFYALSGKKMTTVYYTSPREWNDKIIVTKMFLYDQINTSKHFSMEYSEIKCD